MFNIFNENENENENENDNDNENENENENDNLLPLTSYFSYLINSISRYLGSVQTSSSTFSSSLSI